MYFNFSDSGIFGEEEEQTKACEEIANTVSNICHLRNDANNTALTSDRYKELCLNLLQNSIINGFLKVEEIYFYYKNSEDYAIIAGGEFNMDAIASKTGAKMIFDENDKLVRVSVSLNQDDGSKISLQADNSILVVTPEKTAKAVMNSLENENNQLSDKFITFKNMLKINPVVSAEIDLLQILNQKETEQLPRSIVDTQLIRFVVSNRQNKIQLSIPEEETRKDLKNQIISQTDTINALFDNKTNYQIKEGKTSLFIETQPNQDQVQSISRKAMAFMLHFFIKNIPSNQQKTDS